MCCLIAAGASSSLPNNFLPILRAKSNKPMTHSPFDKLLRINIDTV
jgi:hypothetical protein